LKFCGLFTYHFIRKSLIFILVVIFTLGGMSVLDVVFGDGVIPEPIQLGIKDPIRDMARFNTTQNLYGTGTLVSDQEFWDSLQPTINILHATAPHVEKWMLDQKANGKIKYSSGVGVFATFDCISRELTIHSILLSEQDGVKASILAHEWRHSVQNNHKFTKYVLSYVITRKLHEDLVENDAYLYESQVYEAIYGNVVDMENSVKNSSISKMAKKSCVLNN